jgi:hypothetical protein
MPTRLHRHGRFRRWLGARFGHDEVWGDRIWRRILHGTGAFVLVYYLVPDRFFVIAPKETILLLVLAVVLGIEVARHAIGLELPTIRPYESRRVGSYAFYSIALAGAILLFPVPIATAVILGTAFVDPLAGELRDDPARARGYPAVPFVVYFGLALVSLLAIGRWPVVDAVALSLLAAGVGLAAEWPTVPWLDDDLAMTFAPALVLYATGVLALGLPR